MLQPAGLCSWKLLWIKIGATHCYERGNFKRAASFHVAELQGEHWDWSQRFWCIWAFFKQKISCVSLSKLLVTEYPGSVSLLLIFSGRAQIKCFFVNFEERRMGLSGAFWEMPCPYFPWVTSGFGLLVQGFVRTVCVSDQNQRTVWICTIDDDWNKNIAIEVMALTKGME